MKKILLYWLVFFVLVFGTIILGYISQVPSEWIVATLMVLFYGFQGVSVYFGFKKSKNWIVSSIIVQAMFAIVSPLYFSNFGDPTYEYTTGTWFDTSDSFYPCQLCWWARIMMFPILPLMVTYAITKSRPILWYVYAITIPGMLLELFHYVLQKPYLLGQASIENPFGCTAANPCAAVDVDYFGIFTIPFLCFLAFFFIHIAVSCILFHKRVEKNGK